MHHRSTLKSATKPIHGLGRRGRAPSPPSSQTRPPGLLTAQPALGRVCRLPRWPSTSLWRHRSTADRRHCEALPRPPRARSHGVQAHFVDLVVAACRAARREARGDIFIVVIVFTIGPRVIGMVVDSDAATSAAPTTDPAREQVLVLVDVEQLMSSVDVGRFTRALH